MVGCPDCGDQCSPCDSTLIASVDGLEVDLIPALERARVVGVLDAWAERYGYDWNSDPRAETCTLHPFRWNARVFSGATPDAARAAAAEFIESGEV